MAIEIISKAPASYRDTCAKCGTEFRYELSDVTRKYGYGQPAVACPGCGEEVYHRDQRCQRKNGGFTW